MANFDQLACTTSGAPGNTGFDPNCYLDISQMIGAALVPSSLIIPKASLTSAVIVAFLKTLALNDDPSQRVYPINNLILETAAGGDRREYTDNYGNKLTTGENPYEWTFQYTKGGAQLQAALRKFNSNGQWNVILWDKNNIYMANNGDGTASGFSTNTTWSLPIALNTGQDPTLYRLYIGKTTDDFNDNRYSLAYTGNMQTVKGLQTITLSTVNFTQSTGVANIQVNVGNKNLYSAYKTALSGANKTLWTATNAATGGIISVTSVTANDGLQAFTVTLDTADSDFPSDTSGININLVGPTELNTANVSGFESPLPALEATVVLPTVTLSTSAPNANTAHGTQSQLYITGITGTGNKTPTNITGTLTGTLKVGDITILQLYSNTTADMFGSPVQIGSNVNANSFTSGSTFSFTNTATYGSGTIYFILVASIASGATIGDTIISSKLAIAGLNGTVVDNQTTPGTTKTIS